MKRILITGANSYIGTSFEKYMDADAYSVDTVDTVDGEWRKKSFVGYDVVFHVAGIAHQKETKQNADLYYKVNRDLAIEFTVWIRALLPRRLSLHPKAITANQNGRQSRRSRLCQTAVLKCASFARPWCTEKDVRAISVK